jgi:hypothetical protein
MNDDAMIERLALIERIAPIVFEAMRWGCTVHRRAIPLEYREDGGTDAEDNARSLASAILGEVINAEAMSTGFIRIDARGKDEDSHVDNWGCGTTARQAEVTLHLIQLCRPKNVKAMEYLDNLVATAGPQRVTSLMLYDQVPF